MDLLQFVLVLALLAVVVLVVSAPLRRPPAPREPAETGAAGLEAAKEAKYREIRDAELDLQMGKLSVEDHRQVDRELRAEAVAILTELDELG